MKPTLIRLEPDVLARLQSISDTTGHSLASIIRHCIERQLPALEARWMGNNVTSNNSENNP